MSEPAGNHRPVSVSAISTFRLSLGEDVEFWKRHAIKRVGVSVAKLEAHGWTEGIDLVQRCGVEVANLIGLGPFTLDQPELWRDQQGRIERALEAANALGAPTMIMTTGPAGSLGWEEAADAFERALAPGLNTAQRTGVGIALEHTNSLRPDVSFVHTLRDAIDLARRLPRVSLLRAERLLGGAGTGRDDSFRCRRHPHRAGERLTVGTTSTPDRLVPGDGDIPLRRIIGWILDAGCDCDFDLEIIGPRIEAEGYDHAVPRATTYLLELLTQLRA